MGHRLAEGGIVVRLTALFGIFAASHACAGGPLFVDAAASPGGNGLSWVSAFADLQDAIAAAPGLSASEIWVRAGHYRPDRGTNGRSASFTLPADVSILGGFDGTEDSAGQRNWIQNPTVLSGNIGSLSSSADNSFHVVRASGVGATCVLDGFVVTAGNASGTSSPDDSGGCVLLENAGPTFRNCVVQNGAAKYGGGVALRSGSASFENCVFKQCTATSDGGGVNTNGTATFTSCIFDANNGNFGGGLTACCGVARLVGCTFTGNFANFGGGVFNPIGTLQVVETAFLSNTANNGGGVHTTSANVTVVNCYFGGNTGSLGGGVNASNAPVVANCVFSKNTALSRGAGLYTSGAARLVNCTLYSNWALGQGGGLYAISGVPIIANSVLWSNVDGGTVVEKEQLSGAANIFAISYSCVQGWTGTLGGAGNVMLPPMFADADGADDQLGTLDDNFQLLPGSSCIDAGDTEALPADAADVDGDLVTAEELPVDFRKELRRADDAPTEDTGSGASPMVDIGAIERQAVCAADFDGNGFVSGEDFDAFVAAFSDGAIAADADGDGFVTGEDFDLYVVLFAAGC